MIPRGPRYCYEEYFPKTIVANPKTYKPYILPYRYLGPFGIWGFTGQIFRSGRKTCTTYSAPSGTTGAYPRIYH